jgi:hypothetical protein
MEAYTMSNIILSPDQAIEIAGKTGDLIAELGYWDDKPAIALKAKYPRSSNKDKRYMIPLDHIWLFSEDHYEQVADHLPPDYESFMLAKCLDLYELFDIGRPNSRQLAEVAWLIQDSIDQLMKMPPLVTPRKVVAEAQAIINGEKFTTEVTE